MISTWILARLTPAKDNQLEIRPLYDRFKFETLECKSEHEIPSIVKFVDYIKCIYPEATQERKKVESAVQTIYSGLSIKPLTDEQSKTISFHEIKNNVPQHYQIRKQTSTELSCDTESGCLSSGHTVYKSIIFQSNGTWSLSIGGKVVDLPKLYIDTIYNLNEEGITLVFKEVDKILLCGGVQVKKSIIISRYHTYEAWQASSTSTCNRSVRSLMCMRVVPLNTKVKCCRVCQKMTFSTSEEQKENRWSPNVTKVQVPKSRLERIKDVFPNASEDMIELLLEQSKNVDKHPKGRRWSKKFIGICLQLFNRSPQCYEILCRSQLLLLPSKSLLLLYKNSIKQKPGFDHELFNWMKIEATSQNINEGERYGGLIFDEMAIQADIQIDKHGDVVEIIGFTNYGKEGDLFHSLRRGTTERTTGKYILQLLFLGISGFRFPFAHFITNGIQASELYCLFWQAVYMLQYYTFKVVYTSMDGAQSNRTFMHTCLSNNPSTGNFLARTPCSRNDIIFIMDFSHVMKKIRNNILKSGINSKSTRTLMLPSSCEIHWKMFVDFYEWDRQNALQLHRKLTQEHFNLDTQLKMRNHLAEELLNSEMYNAMKVYKISLGEKGVVLNGVLELLKQTSIIIDIFRDMRPVKSLDDERLKCLRNASSWFKEWESITLNNKDLTQKEKNRRLISQQCREDIQSCLNGFINLCNTLLKISPTACITPGITNSDIIENIFNQQRSTYHGANTNPNALQYQRAINSVIVGQNVVSKKSNAGKTTAICATPYSFNLKQPLKRRNSNTPGNDHNLKVVRA